jgi:cyclase
MHSTLIVARMAPGNADDVAKIFTEFDQTEMPGLMGTRRRELFSYRGLYFHLQDFDAADTDSEGGRERIEGAKSHPLFVDVSEKLKQFIEAYDPQTWRSPADAMAKRFYHWQENG